MATLTVNDDGKWAYSYTARSNMAKTTTIATAGKYLDRDIVINPAPVASVQSSIDMSYSGPKSGDSAYSAYSATSKEIAPYNVFILNGYGGYMAGNTYLYGVKLPSWRSLYVDITKANTKCTIKDGVNDWIWTKDSDGNIYVY